MENYPNNSHKSKISSEKDIQNNAEKRVPKKVIVGNVRTEKKSWIKKVLGLFVSDDISDVKSYLIQNVIVPAVKRTLSDAVEVTLNGESGRKRNRYGNQYISSYQSGRISRDEPDFRRNDYRDLYEIEDIVLDSYGDCELVLDEMNGLIEKYGLVSVSDLYDMVGKTGASHTDCKYGWTSLRTARIVPVRNGFALRFPRVIPLN